MKINIKYIYIHIDPVPPSTKQNSLTDKDKDNSPYCIEKSLTWLLLSRITQKRMKNRGTPKP